MNVALREPNKSTPALDAIAEALLLPSGIDGVYARTAMFEDAVAGLSALISRHREPRTEVLRFPPVMSRRQLEKSGYLKFRTFSVACPVSAAPKPRSVRPSSAWDRHRCQGAAPR